MNAPRKNRARAGSIPASAMLLLMLAVPLLSAGCSKDDGPTGPAVPANAKSVQDGDLRLTVGTDKASYGPGEDVTITIVLTNTGGAPLALDFLRGDPARYPNLNVNVKDDGGTSHFVAGEGTADKTSLGAGASIAYTMSWNQVSRLSRQPVANGDWEVVGFANFDDRDAISVRGLFIELK